MIGALVLIKAMLWLAIGIALLFALASIGQWVTRCDWWKIQDWYIIELDGNDGKLLRIKFKGGGWL